MNSILILLALGFVGAFLLQAKKSVKHLQQQESKDGAGFASKIRGKNKGNKSGKDKSGPF